MVAPYREPTLSPPEPPRFVPWQAFLVSGLVLFSSTCFGPAFAFLALFGLVVGAPVTLIVFATGRRALAGRALLAGLIVATGVFGALYLDRHRGAAMARRNQDLIIPAVYRFHAEQGRYPATLDELVPRYLPSRLPAGPSLPAYRIRYWPWNDSAVLTVTVVPPFGRRIWDFKERRYSFLD